LDMLELPRASLNQKRGFTALKGATDEDIRNEIKWFEQQELKQRDKRALSQDPKFIIPPLDPLFPAQWHLQGNKSNNQVDLNVVEAWKMGTVDTTAQLTLLTRASLTQVTRARA